MKTKKTLISVFALCTAFMLTACGGKDTVSTEKPQDIQTEAGTEKPQDVQTEVGTEKPQDVQAEAGTESTDTSKHKTGRFISAGKPAFCRSCRCMEQGIWHDE